MGLCLSNRCQDAAIARCLVCPEVLSPPPPVASSRSDRQQTAAPAPALTLLCPAIWLVASHTGGLDTVCGEQNGQSAECGESKGGAFLGQDLSPARPVPPGPPARAQRRRPPLRSLTCGNLVDAHSKAQQRVACRAGGGWGGGARVAAITEQTMAESPVARPPWRARVPHPSSVGLRRSAPSNRASPKLIRAPR